MTLLTPESPRPSKNAVAKARLCFGSDIMQDKIHGPVPTGRIFASNGIFSKTPPNAIKCITKQLKIVYYFMIKTNGHDPLNGTSMNRDKIRKIIGTIYFLIVNSNLVVCEEFFQIE